MAIISIRHKGLKRLWTKGDSSKLEAHLVPKIIERLDILDQASNLDEIAQFPELAFHPLNGVDRYSIKVDKNWRLTFEFDDSNVYILDYEDYH